MPTVEVYFKRKGAEIQQLREELGASSVSQPEKDFYVATYNIPEKSGAKSGALRVIGHAFDLEGLVAIKMIKH